MYKVSFPIILRKAEVDPAGNSFAFERRAPVCIIDPDGHECLHSTCEDKMSFSIFILSHAGRVFIHDHVC